MERTIIAHNCDTGKATVRFTHNGITLTGKYDCWALIPGTRKVFTDLGMEFGESAQLMALDYLERMLLPEFESGNIIGDPVEPEPVVNDAPLPGQPS